MSARAQQCESRSNALGAVAGWVGLRDVVVADWTMAFVGVCSRSASLHLRALSRSRLRRLPPLAADAALSKPRAAGRSHPLSHTTHKHTHHNSSPESTSPSRCDSPPSPPRVPPTTNHHLARPAKKKEKKQQQQEAEKKEAMASSQLVNRSRAAASGAKTGALCRWPPSAWLCHFVLQRYIPVNDAGGNTPKREQLTPPPLHPPKPTQKKQKQRRARTSRRPSSTFTPTRRASSCRP